MDGYETNQGVTISGLDYWTGIFLFFVHYKVGFIGSRQLMVVQEPAADY